MSLLFILRAYSVTDWSITCWSSKANRPIWDLLAANYYVSSQKFENWIFPFYKNHKLYPGNAPWWKYCAFWRLVCCACIMLCFGWVKPFPTISTIFCPINVRVSFFFQFIYFFCNMGNSKPFGPDDVWLLWGYETLKINQNQRIW